MVKKNDLLLREDEIKTAIQKMGYVIVPKVVLYDPLLSSKELAVYIALLSRDWTKSRQCFPSVFTISKESGVSRSSVKRSLDGLIEKGLLEKEKRLKESGAVDSNLYKIKRLDDVYCPGSDYMVLTDEYQARMRGAKKGYLVDRVFNQSVVSEKDDAEEVTPQDKHSKKVEDEADKKADRMLQAFDDVEDNVAKAKNNKERNKARKEKYGLVRVKTDSQESLDEENLPKELNVNDAEAAWNLAELKAWPDGKHSGNGWDLASKGIAARLMKQYGAEELIELIIDMFGKWDEYKERYHMRGYPNMKRIAYWAESWFNDIDRGKDDLVVRSNRDVAIAQGESNEGEEDISYAEFGNGRASG